MLEKVWCGVVVNPCTTGYPLYLCAVRGRKIGSPRLRSRLHISLLELHSKVKWKEGKEEKSVGEKEERKRGRMGREGEGKEREGK